MIFLNRGEDYTKHECISCDEAQLRYPELKLDDARPYEANGKKLREMRTSARVTIRELSRRSASLKSEIGAPLSFVEISDIEHGRTTLADVDMDRLYRRLTLEWREQG